MSNAARECLARNVLGEIRAELERRLCGALPSERMCWLKALSRLEIVAAHSGPRGEVEKLVELARSTHGLEREFQRHIAARVARSLRAIESNDALRGP